MGKEIVCVNAKDEKMFFVKYNKYEKE